MTEPELDLGLGKLCLKLPVLCYAGNSSKCNYYASRGSCINAHITVLTLIIGTGKNNCYYGRSIDCNKIHRMKRSNYLEVF